VLKASSEASRGEGSASGRSLPGAVRGSVWTPIRAFAAHREWSILAVLCLVYASFAMLSRPFLSPQAAGNYLDIAAEIGISAAAMVLLMTAGEFDLSIGSMVGASEMLMAYLILRLHWPLGAALVVTCGFAALVGLMQAQIIVRTGLPSFLVTLAGLFVLLGLAEGFGLILLGTTQVSGVLDALKGDPLINLFHGRLFDFLPVSTFWWLGATLVSAFVLHQTRFGNWVYGTGGNLQSALKSGVPVYRVKTFLYMGTACASTLVGALIMLSINTAAAAEGSNLLFEVVTVAVIGGTLITGGKGSPIGAAIAALLFGVISQGFFLTDIPQYWYNVFVGLMLLGAVLVDRYAAEIAASGSARAQRSR
jgi:simple sugar transport system permease protein